MSPLNYVTNDSLQPTFYGKWCTELPNPISKFNQSLGLSDDEMDEQ